MQETATQSAAAFQSKAIEFYNRHAVALTPAAATYSLSQAEKYERFAQAAIQRAQEEAQAAPVVEVGAIEAKPIKARCPHYKAIQTFGNANKKAA